MKKILLTIDKLENFSQTETTFFDVMEHFAVEGWQVDVITKRASSYWQHRINGATFQKQIRFVDAQELSLQPVYALIWIFQGYVSPQLNDALLASTVSGRIVFQHFDNYADNDLPYGARLENKLAWLSLACSTHSYVTLAEKGIKQSRIKYFPLSATLTFCTTETKPTALSKMLFVSQGSDKNLIEKKEALASFGISLDHINLAHAMTPLSAELLSQYQLIMANGRSVVQALCLGIPSVVADQTRSAGFVGEENLTALNDASFCCSGKHVIEDWNGWAQEIVEGFDTALAWTRTFRVQAQQHWNLDSIIEKLIQKLPEPVALSINEEEHQRFDLHRRVMDTIVDEGVSVDKWLNDRVPSPTRVEVLKSFIQSYPEYGQIAVAIIDRDGENSLTQKTLASLEKQLLLPCAIRVLAQADGSISLALNKFVFDNTFHGVLIVEAGAVVLPHALLLWAEHCLRDPTKPVWYCDDVITQANSELGLYLKPECDIDLLRSWPYFGRNLFITRDAFCRFDGVEEGFDHLIAQSLCWRIIENMGPGAIGHISEVLMLLQQPVEEWAKSPKVQRELYQATSQHLDRCNVAAAVSVDAATGLARIAYPIDSHPLISIIIPGRDRLPLLQRCIDSLVEVTQYANYEILIIDNASEEQETLSYLHQMELLNISRIKVLRYNAPFNFAAMNNLAVQHAKGQVFLFLNNDVQIIQPDWLEQLLQHVLRPEVGIVGARLEFDGGDVEHGGYITGVGEGVATAHRGADSGSSGFMMRLQAVRGATAVSAACMMMRRDVFEEVGGFDEQRLPVYFSDVDIALSVREKNYLTLWTPYARVRHAGGATRLFKEKFGIEPHPNQDTFSILIDKWGSKIAQDNFYNRQLAKVGSLFQLGTRTSRIHQPLPGKPLPVFLATHTNWTGCGNYRVIKPFKALEQTLALEGGLIHGVPSVMEVATAEPDIILLALPIDDAIIPIIENYRKVSNAKIVLEYDDNYLNISQKNDNISKMPKNMASRMRRIAEHADWIVVSTEPLAQAYAHLHSDLRVARNKLDIEQWGHLRSKKRGNVKPRVGWAGGTSHKGDLEILLPLIKELSNEVDWVFMGMKPQGVECEFHMPVPFERYPEKLSSLDLDLALVPLEDNIFNECKSNLRLLELGACGVPIICTDIAPYRCGLPVTRVQNRFHFWLKTIREHLADRQALEEAGNTLRAAIHQEWLLDEQGAQEWREAWLG